MEKFEFEDPFNTKNKLEGFVCKKRGSFESSLFIYKINNELLKNPQKIYAIPNLKYPYKNQEKNEILNANSFKTTKKYCFMNKWNGTNILVYKYIDNQQNEYYTAKTKGHYTLGNSKFGNFLDLTLQVFEEKKIIEFMKNENENESFQSFSFELCGKLEPHLVKYNFDIDLKPLFKTKSDGRIKPIIKEEKDEIKNYKYTELIKDIESFQNNSFELNEKYRKDNELSIKYEYDHFITEGYVLYLLNEDNFLLDRIMYKIKPKDIEEVHWKTFDQNMKGIKYFIFRRKFKNRIGYEKKRMGKIWIKNNEIFK
eukprot:gene2651-3848_t